MTYDIADVVQHLEFTVRSCTLGMDDSFRDPFAVEMREEIDQVEILKEQGSIFSNALGGLGVHNLFIRTISIRRDATVLINVSLIDLLSLMIADLVGTIRQIIKSRRETYRTAIGVSVSWSILVSVRVYMAGYWLAPVFDIVARVLDTSVHVYI